MGCRMFNSILGLYSLDVSTIPHPLQAVPTNNVSLCCQMSAEVRSRTRWRTTALDQRKDFVTQSGSSVLQDSSETGSQAERKRADVQVGGESTWNLTGVGWDW